MAQQWGTGQPGFQYPAQTGFAGNSGQFPPNFGGGLAPQQTGFPGQRPAFQQAQPTGFLGGIQPQQTGFPGSGFQQQQGGQSIPPVPPLPTGFNGSGFGQPQQQRAPPPPPPPRSFLNASPAYGGGGLVPQVTGFPGAASPLVPQVTGFIDPRLQMLSSSFMPANSSIPLQGGQLQFAQQPAGGVQNSISQYNQEMSAAPPKMNWALTREEKKKYDQIFRAWDANGTGFINGSMALDVFGQSGLSKPDLAKIWALADQDNRGKLNLAEFHVAMGLIYRKLNGVEIPDQLPPELVPPSSRDLDTSVNFLKDILKNDTSRPGSTGSTGSDVISRSKVRSFNDNSPLGAGGRKDASVYRYTDDGDTGSYYRSRSRHIDRNDVRVGNESPGQDLESMRRQLENASRQLEQNADERASRTREDEELEREMEDLRYRVKRIQEDLEYVSRGPRSNAKDDERRKLERDLLHLMHERIPEVQRKQEERERRREQEKREWQRDRDRRNERFGRYDDRGYDRDRDEGGYSRGTYDRDRDYDRDRRRDERSRDRDYDRDRDHDRDRDYDRDRSYGRDRDREYDRDRDRNADRDRPRSPPQTARSPPPAPPAPASSISKPPAAPKPTASPAPDTKHMTAEQRAAFIREQAQRRLQERMRALGVVTPAPAETGASSPTVDTSVEDRLAQDKKEAELKAQEAEKAAEERERLRKERLDNERALKDGRPTTPSAAVATPPAPPAPAAIPRTISKPPAPVPPKRAPAPPPPAKRGPLSRPPVAPAAVASPTPPAPAPPVRAPVAPPVVSQPEEDPVEKEIREREERLRRQKEARLERLRQLEREEEDARRAEEEFEQRRREHMNVAKSPVSTPASPPTQIQAPPPPPPPPVAPPAPAVVSPPASDKSSTNPFSKFMSQGGQSATSTPSSVSNGGTNPFFKPSQPAAVTPPAAPSLPPSVVAPPTARVSSPPVTRSPAPPTVKTSYNTVPKDEDDWDDANEIDEDDSSEDEISSSRNARDRLAQQLFGGGVARPQSTTGSIPSQPQTPAPKSAPAMAAPSLPPPAPPAPMTAPVSPISAPPPAPEPPAPPMAPPAPAAPQIAAPIAAPAGDRGALMGSILAGARLKKTVTNDRSGASVTGQVIGDTAPPDHISIAPRSASPPSYVPPAPAAPEAGYEAQEARANHRQSVDWYAGLAAEQGAMPAMPPRVETIEEAPEERETAFEEVRAPAAVPEIQVQEAPQDESSDALADIDRSKEYRVRSLYAYEGQRPEDLSFSENIIIIAHPSKSGGAWWYGTTVKDGKAGFFPSTYVQELENVRAKALYSYTGGNADELPFVEGDELTIIDRSDADWWKTEQGGVIFIVPTAYFEIVEDKNGPRSTDKKETGSGDIDEQPPKIGEPSHNSQATTMTTAQNAYSSYDSDEGTSSASDEEYHSFDSSEYDSENENNDGTHDPVGDGRKEHEARELERQRVLEAAGLLVVQPEHAQEREQEQDATENGARANSRPSTPPPRPPRRRSTRRRRRTPPQTPGTNNADANRLSIVSVSSDKEKELPQPPTPGSVLHVDDAFERYEAYRQSKNWRMSISSIDTGPPSPGLGSAAISATPSRDGGEQRHLQSGHSHIFNFLTRSKTPTHEPERPRLQISAPILNTRHSMESIQRPGSPSFGSSWSSLLGKDTLEGIPNLERKRQEAIFELINTEAAYVRDLQLIVEVFYSSLTSLLSEKEVAVVFANIEDLLLVNTAFLSSLEERQKECRLYVDKIGDLLDRHMINMGAYTEYCVNQANGIKLLQSIRESRSDVEAALQRLRDNPAVRNLDLSSYLLSPMQRITRYPLLIRQVLHNTEGESDRKQIMSGLESVERVLAFINEAIREQEGRARLESISKNLYVGQGRLDLARSTSYMGVRKLLKEGTLMKYKSGRKLRIFLCNDLLILTDEKITRLYKMPIQLNQVDVKELSGKDELGFQLVFAYPRGGEAMAFKATSAQECKTWMKAIYSACRRARDVERRAAQKAAASRR